MPPEKDNGKIPAAPRPTNPVLATTLARARLECTAGPEKGQTFRVAPGMTTVGRDPSCDVILTETVVSRQHFRIDRRADQWVLRNLSSNGTLLNKKPVDEAALGDGDDIRIGSKTRFRFVVESVALSSTGRPQFRRRTGAPEEAEAAGEEAQAAAAEEGKPSLFKRRRGLFIGLAAYLALMVIAGGIAAYYKWIGPGKTAAHEVAVMGLDDAVRPAPGERPLRIVGEDQQGIRAEDERGQPVLVPAADLESGKARRITGIRKAVDVKYLEAKNAQRGYLFTIEEANPVVGKQCEKQALDLYRLRYLPGKEASLYGAVRLFQKALAYNGGRGYFEDPAVDKVYREALKELIETVDRHYRSAVIHEQAGTYKKASETYKHVLSIFPERENPIFGNVAQRLEDLKRRYPDLP